MRMRRCDYQQFKMQVKKVAIVCAGLLCLAQNIEVRAERPDSVWVYLYTTPEGGNHDGLHWAWSADREHWLSPFPAQKLVSSDYGIWGAEKRMFAPFAMRGNDGCWHVLWGVSETDNTFAVTSSKDLISWKPQSYPAIGVPGSNCMLPEVSYDVKNDSYLVTWLTVEEGDTLVSGCVTPDFKRYSASRTVPGNTRLDSRVAIPSVAPEAVGTVGRISRGELDNMIRYAESIEFRNRRYNERPADDSTRFASLKNLKAGLVASGEPRDISPMLMGIFFEDISRAADGGLYAELIQNRDFEYQLSDRRESDASWNARRSWSVAGEGISFEIDTVAPIHVNNRHYAVIESQGKGGIMSNEGFNGIAVKQGAKYDLSLFARNAGCNGKGNTFKVGLRDAEGKELCSAKFKASDKWVKLSAVLTPSVSDDSAVLTIEPVGEGRIAVDMVSLFPRDTFKGRRNGLRRDLADSIAALRPRFVRFPGGCVAHGDGLGNIYRWKNTIGPLEARVPQRNIWGYHQTAGLGYHEYFEFCEDLGAEPLPVVAAGVPCQNSSCGGAGQQGGIPMDEMPGYVQDVLDLIEYANGDARATHWGRERARNGHPKPFNLKYLGVGNEDLISDVFEPRFEMIYEAVKQRYPEIIVIGTVGPFHSGSDYDEGWEFASRLGVPMVDEHYYESPSWFIYNQDFYDGYDRKRPHVYLGEYASRGNEVYNALAEAAYLCGVERNGDVVEMTSYAPLLAKVGQTNWNPDLIYFTNTEVLPTVNYRVQRLFGENCGTKALPVRLLPEGTGRKSVTARLASSVVTDESGDVIIKMVNILPVDVSADLALEDVLHRLGVELSDFGGQCSKTVLCGEPGSRDAKMEESDVTISSLADSQQLPAYSFTVYRLVKLR